MKLGEYYQGKPELLQACLNDMEHSYNEVAAELTAARARISALETAAKGAIAALTQSAVYPSDISAAVTWLTNALEELTQ